MSAVKRCSVCGRFHRYDADDVFCVGCGHESLESECACGRVYDYLDPDDDSVVHCPRCGGSLRGRHRDYLG